MADPQGELQHPLVQASWETRGYWEGAARGELVLQRCRACGTVQHKPRAICATCLSSDIEHFVASGRGTVYTFTVTEQNMTPPFRDAVPYVMAYDVRPLLTLSEKQEILTRAVKENWLLFFEHDPKVESVSLQQTEKGIRKKEEVRVADL